MTNKITFLGEAADKQFKKWQSENVEAFYLNVRGSKAMLHKSDCWHLGDGDGMNSARNPKVCSSISGELKKWAEDNKLEFQTCPDCDKR